uniref:Putative secreted protein n=1 Tax=Ixodes ricinus TaxID=34613 RepID=A0A147BJK7_IXORI
MLIQHMPELLMPSALIISLTVLSLCLARTVEEANNGVLTWAKSSVRIDVGTAVEFVGSLGTTHCGGHAAKGRRGSDSTSLWLPPHRWLRGAQSMAWPASRSALQLRLDGLVLTVPGLA